MPFQPAPLAWGGWAAVPFDACHGAIWLREKLSASRADPKASMGLATHSLKATVLSWLSKAACPSDLQRRAGYHVSASEKNPLEYERDGQAGFCILYMLRIPAFRPLCSWPHRPVMVQKLRPRLSPFLLALAVFGTHSKAWKHAKCWCRQQFCVSGKCTNSALTRGAAFADPRSISSA